MFDMVGIVDTIKRNPTVEVIEFVNYNDGGPFRLSSDGRELKILNEVARVLAELPNAKTEGGHVTPEGYHIYGEGGYDAIEGSHKCKARVHRPAQNQ
jgi:hypothetical protein